VRFVAEDVGMGKETKRSGEMRRMLEEYRASGLSRRAFCEERRMPLTTFDYWRREHEIKARKQARAPRMVRVKVAANESAGQFTLSLANGRRIESSWQFADVELARLIGIAESA
jgi:hypothetical protein